MQFLIHGSIAYDLLLHHDGSFPDAIDPKNLQKLSVGFLAQRMIRHHGGTAANIGWNLRLLGQDPLIVGTVGMDGGPYTALLTERGIAIDHIEQRTDAITATAIIASDEAERQITFFHPGADPLGTLPDFTDEREEIAYAIVSPRNAMLMLKAAEQCKQTKIPFLFDPGQQSNLFSRDEFRRTITGSQGLVVNAYEWALAQEKLQWEADEILNVCPMIVITQGEQGLTIHTREDTIVISACTPDQFINPTGAGDALRAGLLIGLAKKWPLVQAGRLGAAMGSFAVEQEGTLIDHLDIADVRERVVSNYDEELPKF